MALSKVLESSIQVRFHDCDPFNHLNNSRYIDYVFAARTDQLREHYQLNLYHIAREKGIGWVSVQTQISYLAPANLGEDLTIVTQLLAFSAKSLLFEAFVWDKTKTVLKAVLWLKLAHFHLASQKSHQHSAELMQLFGAVVNPLPEETDFDTRIRNLKAIA